jgi:hypothetical protein
MASRAMEAVSPCPCGSAELEEIEIKLEIEVQSVTGSWPRPLGLFMRTCRDCGQVTFWTESSRTHKAAEPIAPKDLLDP